MKTSSTTKIDQETGEILSVYTTPFLRTPYNYDRDIVSRETGTENNEPTLAQQQFKDECDINTIMERFGQTGLVPTNVRQPLSEDFIEAMDYQGSLNALIAAEEAFLEMPAKIRAEFDNNPAKFIAFFEDEKNRDRATALGLVKTPPEAPKEAPQGGSQGGKTETP